MKNISNVTLCVASMTIGAICGGFLSTMVQDLYRRTTIRIDTEDCKYNDTRSQISTDCRVKEFCEDYAE